MPELPSMPSPLTLVAVAVGIYAVLVLLGSLRWIGPNEVGLIIKHLSTRKLSGENLIALHGEAGYQADLLMPGIRWCLWPRNKVVKFPWVQVPAGEIGVVIAQVGDAPLGGAKSGVYRPEFGNFTDLRLFMTKGGQKGVQRPVLPPGSLLPMHPVAFLVVTKKQIFGQPIAPELRDRSAITPESFGLAPEQLELVRVAPAVEKGRSQDMIGIVTTLEGSPLPSGDIAGRLGGFDDVREMEAAGAKDLEILERLLGNKNALHNNYQNFQAFLDAGGKIGVQHDPLLDGAYALNPFLVKVERVPMLVVMQGEVAVIKAYVGLVTQDTSGDDFKYGALSRPGHRGLWQEPLRTGKYAINPRCYGASIVPTSILTLNWSNGVSAAHRLDIGLKQIETKSKEGFVFRLDLQVQIHVPDMQSSRVISMVGTMESLVGEVLHAAVGNHFRDTLQSMQAIEFIEARKRIQAEALGHISKQLERYHVETKGVYIQDVVFPEELQKVLTVREIARQEIETYRMQMQAEDQRVTLERSRGEADMQASLARSKVGVEIKTNDAASREAEARGEAAFIRETGVARSAEVEAVGLARARAYTAQVEALGQGGTVVVNALTGLAEKNARLVPDILVMGSGGGASSSLDALAATLTGLVRQMKPEAMAALGAGGAASAARPKAPVEPAPAAEAAPAPPASPERHATDARPARPASSSPFAAPSGAFAHAAPPPPPATIEAALTGVKADLEARAAGAVTSIASEAADAADKRLEERRRAMESAFSQAIGGTHTVSVPEKK